MSAVIADIASTVPAKPVIIFTVAAAASTVTLTFETAYGRAFDSAPKILAVTPRNAAGDATAKIDGDPTATSVDIVLAGTGTITCDVLVQGSLASSR